VIRAGALGLRVRERAIARALRERRRDGDEVSR
jgi:hypothetical protein